MTPVTSMMGHFSRISSGVIRWQSSIPMVWKIRYAACSHSQRSGTEATVIPPVMCSPMS